jgi:putative protease
LIIQDGAIALLCRRYFPNLNIHASTLMTVHNCAGVEQLETMGFQRAVLARELTIEELTQIAADTRLELEIFVHGALCFSYSGLCLASSFYGGRSSLRGRCVQPCRRLYHSGRQQGYFFSANDLSAIDLIPRLRHLRLAAFKIEGRMKPASHVAAVVRAYRLVLDAAVGKEAEAVAKARRLLREAHGRKPTQGFFLAEKHKEIITPHRSGASGRLAARVEWVRGKRMALRPRFPLAEGDRLRLDSDEAVEKSAFTLRNMLAKGQRLTEVTSGTVVTVSRIPGARRGDRIFKTGSKARARTSVAKLRRILRERTSSPPALSSSSSLAKKILARPKMRGENNQPNTFYLRLSQSHLLNAAFDSGASWIVLQATQPNLHSLLRRKLPPKKRARLVWALPAIIHEQDLPSYQEQIRRLQQVGHGRWLLANWAHFRLFTQQPEWCIADYSFNVINSQASALLGELGCHAVILSLENDRDNLRKLLPAIRGLTPLVTVYGWPPLYTSRLEVRPRAGAAIHGSGRDRFQHRRQAGLTPVRSDRPFCLLEDLQELRQFGAKDFVVDLRGQRLRPEKMQALTAEMWRPRCPQPHSKFNYLGKLA